MLEWCAREDRACILVLARPYHMDPGIGHEIEVDIQAYGYPILWVQYLPVDADLLGLGVRRRVRAGHIKSPLDIRDVWPSSYSSNTNEILWGAKVAARMPWITCVVRLSSYECGMDQPTYTPVQQIVERSGTLFFSFQDLDSTKPAGSVKIRVETITHYLAAARGDRSSRRRRRQCRPLARSSRRPRSPSRASGRPRRGRAPSGALRAILGSWRRIRRPPGVGDAAPLASEGYPVGAGPDGRARRLPRPPERRGLVLARLHLPFCRAYIDRDHRASGAQDRGRPGRRGLPLPEATGSPEPLHGELAAAAS